MLKRSRQRNQTTQQGSGDIPLQRRFFGSPELGYLSTSDVTAEVDKQEIYFPGRAKSRTKQRENFIWSTFRAAENTLGMVNRARDGVYIGYYTDDRKPPVADIVCELGRESEDGGRLLCLDALVRVTRIFPDAEYPLPFRELPKHDLTSRILLSIISQRQA